MSSSALFFCASTAFPFSCLRLAAFSSRRSLLLNLGNRLPLLICSRQLPVPKRTCRDQVCVGLPKAKRMDAASAPVGDTGSCKLANPGIGNAAPHRARPTAPAYPHRSPRCPDNWINRQKYYVLQLGDLLPIPADWTGEDRSHLWHPRSALASRSRAAGPRSASSPRTCPCHRSARAPPKRWASAS